MAKNSTNENTLFSICMQHGMLQFLKVCGVSCALEASILEESRIPHE